jgi:hypothetical protein
MLYKPELFEPLTDEPWNEERVRQRIRAIVADADAAYSPETLWPAHEWDVWGTEAPLKNLYVGAAGVVWALGALRRRGYEGALDLGVASERTLELWRERTDFIRDRQYPLPSQAKSALLTGESGILVVAWELTRSPELADDLFERVVANVANEAEELMWGSPGTLLAAGAMYAWTGDERWADAWRESAAALLERRDEDGLWTQRLYKGERRGLSVPHGVVGNVAALLGGGPLLADDVRETLRRETAALLARTAVVEDGVANWPHPEGREDARSVQWCIGAPGTIIAATEYLDDELLLAGAELPWRTGPFGREKGAGICHGTAGNGYAFLKAFGRTGDERWLERGRRFAMHALEQVERRGHGRYSLWTGDVGVALFAADCLDAHAEYPIVDSWSTAAAGTRSSG